MLRSVLVHNAMEFSVTARGNRMSALTDGLIHRKLRLSNLYNNTIQHMNAPNCLQEDKKVIEPADLVEKIT